MNNVFVGEDIILPRSLRSQNAYPYAIKTKNLYLVRRGDLRSPAISVTAARSSIAQKRDLQKPSLVREHVAKRLSSFLRKRRVADKRSLRSAG